MCLARPALPHEDHWLGAVDVAAFPQLANLGRRNVPRLMEIELLERFQPWQPGLAQPVLDRVPVAFLRFHRQQCFQIADVAALLFDRLFGEAHEVRGYDRHAQRLAILLHAGLFESLRGLVHGATSAPLALTPSNKSYSSIVGSGRS